MAFGWTFTLASHANLYCRINHPPPYDRLQLLGVEIRHEFRLCLTASQVTSTMRGWFGSTTGASGKIFYKRADQAGAHSGDRVWDMAFRPQGRILWVDNLRVRQTSGRARWNEVLRGESSSARRSKIRSWRCTAWRDDASRASRVLHSGRARPPA